MVAYVACSDPGRHLKKARCPRRKPTTAIWMLEGGNTRTVRDRVSDWAVIVILLTMGLTFLWMEPTLTLQMVGVLGALFALGWFYRWVTRGSKPGGSLWIIWILLNALFGYLLYESGFHGTDSRGVGVLLFLGFNYLLMCFCFSVTRP
jgi:hypothetical protein